MEEFAKEIAAQGYKTCGLVLMAGDEGYDIEVELVPDAVIGGVWATNSWDSEYAAEQYCQIRACLEAWGFSVLTDRETWEEYWEGEA